MAKRNYAEPATFRLPQDTPDKTVDLGHNGMSVSTNAQGQVRIDHHVYILTSYCSLQSLLTE